MRIFLIKFILFLLLLMMTLAAVLGYLAFSDGTLSASTEATESALLSIPQNTDAGLLIAGSSHGRMLSRGVNHCMLENVTGVKVVNISKSAAGIVPEYEFLKYYYKKGNTAKVIFYFIDGFVFFSPKWNEGLYCYADEPFRLDFFLQLLPSGTERDVILNYIESKYQNDWLTYNASRVPDQSGRLERADTAAIRKRLDADYLDGLDMNTAATYSKKLDALIELAQRHESSLVFIISPSLLTHDPGLDFVRKTMLEKKKKYGVQFYDLSESYKNPRLFYNHDHLNVAGVFMYSKYFMLPVLDSLLQRHSDNLH
ncbi:MAG: hypothetical protein WCM76_11085 [Bacteroidota bacterium]